MTKNHGKVRTAASAALLAAWLIGCGGSHLTTTPTPTPPPPAPITGIAIPSNVSVVTATNSN